MGCGCLERGTGEGFWCCGFKKNCWIITALIIALTVIILTVLIVVVILFTPGVLKDEGKATTMGPGKKPKGTISKSSSPKLAKKKTTPTPIPTSPPKIPPGMEEYQFLALTEHNNYRKRHGVPPLVHNQSLCVRAMECAEHYYKKRKGDHSCNVKGGSGENIIHVYGGDFKVSTQKNKITMARKANGGWYDEVKLYDYKKAIFSKSTGHFTQLVWKNSKKFCYSVYILNKNAFGVALYYPRGNYIGAFRKNVFKPK